MEWNKKKKTKLATKATQEVTFNQCLSTVSTVHVMLIIKVNGNGCALILSGRINGITSHLYLCSITNKDSMDNVL